MRAELYSTIDLGRRLIVAAFLIGVSTHVFAQGPPPGAGNPANPNPRAEERSRQISEGRLRSAEMEAGAENENQKHVQAAILNMKEDFTRIQVIRNDIARNLVAKKPLDYTLIAEQTSEIHKRCNRLNLYIMAHAPEVKDATPSDAPPEEMTLSLVKLCKLIDSFTENPALKNVATLDVKHLDKVKEEKAHADKDLLEIIKISGTIQRRAEDLRGSN